MKTHRPLLNQLLANACLLGLSAVWVHPIHASEPQKTSFASDIRPILSKCITCHGPSKQENGLRLDNARDAAKLKAIVAGHASESGLIKRVTSADPDLRMPPVETGNPLTPKQVETLRNWIDSGAEYTPHWAFQPITNPQPPDIKTAWVKNSIDPFILSTLNRLSLTPSPEADKASLLRRVSLDLTGLPPTPAESIAFQNDRRPDAYEHQVQRLLASPHYGERQARHWLDLARYADSNGYTIDGPRSIWPWRDWVIKALNQDMPFDQFTLEQLAGDLIPNATQEQILATGFHRNTAFNEEGGTDPEQFRVERTIDRTNTTGTVWLGMTVGCAQCHDHKYDPIRQRDYYQLFAYFNNVDEPKISVNSPKVQAEVQQLKRQLADLETQNPLARSPALPTNDEINQFRFASRNAFQIAPISKAIALKASLEIQPDQSILASGTNAGGETYKIQFKSPFAKLSAIRLETLTDPSLPKTGPGRGSNGQFRLLKVRLSQNNQNLPLSSADADIEQTGFPVSETIQSTPMAKGWSTHSGTADGPNQPGTAIFRLSNEMAVSADSIFTLELQFPDKPAGAAIGKFRISVTDAGTLFLNLPIPAQAIITSTLAPLEPSQKQAFIDLVQLKSQKADPKAVRLRTLIRTLEETTTSLALSVPASPRTTRILQRGDFLQPGEPVNANTPQVFDHLKPIPEKTAPDRVQLAKWLTRPDHPLTSRVAVNREWQKFFGSGLVETENDFGLQGSLPTHPELLDALASRFMADGWSLKRLHYLIVTSATYRQSSRHRPDLNAMDPQNRYFGRQNRLRLDAETIRDNALAVTGQFAKTIGGPPVFPPQPAELFQFTQSQRGWKTSTGPDRYRRGLYTWIWRQSRHPLLTTFDAADALTACTRRNRSNTPIQALHLANDPVFVELAESWARQVLALHPSASDTTRLQSLYQASFNRPPADPETARLLHLISSERSAGHSEQQSWTTIARVLMNTDEFITRE
ncbi:MAG: PSD1 and planctomycete cytochrome C domain-containing protein [Planctomycetota bacterium]